MANDARLDADLEGLARDALVDEVKRLRAAIRVHRDSEGHDLCWHHPALWGLLPDRTDPLPVVPPWPDFLHGCLRYRRALDDELPRARRVAGERVAAMMWRRLDMLGLDACVLVRDGAVWRLEGHAIFVHDDGSPARLAYELECDDGWRSMRARVDGTVGTRALTVLLERRDAAWLVNGAPSSVDVHACVDLDLGFTPATNLAHLRRARLAIGEESEVVAAWLDVDSKTLTRLPQTYRRVDERTYHYESPTASYVADLVVDEESGFVREYPSLWTAVATRC